MICSAEQRIRGSGPHIPRWLFAVVDNHLHHLAHTKNAVLCDKRVPQSAPQFNWKQVDSRLVASKRLTMECEAGKKNVVLRRLCVRFAIVALEITCREGLC